MFRILVRLLCPTVRGGPGTAESGARAGGEGGGREGAEAIGHLFHGEEILGADEKEAEKEKDHR